MEFPVDGLNLLLRWDKDATDFFARGGYTVLRKWGDGLQVYMDLVILLNFLVDFLLLLGTNQLAGYPLGVPRAALAAGLGGAYAGVCMLRGFQFLGSTLWRIVSLGVMAIIAFGWNRGTLRRGTLFILLSMALGGIAVGLDSGGFVGILLSAAAVAALCILGFRGKAGSRSYVPVELFRNGKRFRLIALQDTGNTLKDPVSGQQVIVAGPDIAWDVLGLTPTQLSDPISTMEQGKYPGLRLIPYRAVGQSSGMLLAVRFDEVKVGGVETGQLVAFSPNGFGTGAVYQALTGGVI